MSIRVLKISEGDIKWFIRREIFNRLHSPRIKEKETEEYKSKVILSLALQTYLCGFYALDSELTQDVKVFIS